MTRPRLTILVKLILAYVVPTVAVFAVFAAIAHEVARRDLEGELGARVAAVASSAATQLRDKSLARLGPGSEDDVRYQRCQTRLRDVAEATGVARIYVFNRDHESVCDTEAGVGIGTTYYHLEADAPELDRVFGDGASTSSILFEGVDGREYKPGYAPVRFVDGEIELAVGVDAPPLYFARLADLRRSLVLYGALFALVVLIASVIVAALITRPVRSLAAAADRIGRGDLASPIDVPSRDEIGYLAVTMDQMRDGLHARDERMQLMLSGIAHEVRNPLGGIALFAGILRDELDDDDEKQGHVQRIEKEMTHLKAVVGDFLEYARRPKPQLEEVDLGEFARELCALERADADAAGVELSCETDGVVCRADRQQLKRALLNLVRNAIQAASGAEPPVAGIRARVEPLDPSNLCSMSFPVAPQRTPKNDRAYAPETTSSDTLKAPPSRRSSTPFSTPSMVGPSVL